jgi:hypothetical protein
MKKLVSFSDRPIKGIVSRGSGLFFILMRFSCLNFKKLVLRGKDLSELMFLELLPIRKFFVPPHITAVLHKECAGKQNKIT